MQRTRWFTLLVVLVLQGLLATPLLAAQTPVAGPITQQVLEGSGLGDRTVMLAVNDADEVAGLVINTDTLESHALLWDADGAAQQLPSPAGWSAAAFDINDHGESVGVIENLDANDDHAIPVIWTADGITELPLDGAHGGTAYSINSEGIVLGAIDMTGDGKLRPVRWIDGELALMPLPEDFPFVELGDGNDDGLMVGTAGNDPLDTAAIICHDDGCERLPDFATSGGESAAWAINNDGVIVGYSEDEQQVERAVIWVDGQPQELETPEGFESSIATAIGNQGLVVGHATRPNAMMQPVAWHEGHAYLLPTHQPGGATGVNAHGLIVGWIEDGEGAVPSIWTFPDNPEAAATPVAVIPLSGRMLRSWHVAARSWATSWRSASQHKGERGKGPARGDRHERRAHASPATLLLPLLAPPGARTCA
jgi:probable HAF family extracellular repeat protein